MDDQLQQLHDFLTKGELTPFEVKECMLATYVMISRQNQEQGNPDIGLNQQVPGLLGHINGFMGAVFWERGYDFDHPTVEQLSEIKTMVDGMVQIYAMPEPMQETFNDIYQAIMNVATGQSYTLLPNTKKLLDIDPAAVDAVSSESIKDEEPQAVSDSSAEEESFFKISDLGLSPTDFDDDSEPSKEEPALPEEEPALPEEEPALPEEEPTLPEEEPALPKEEPALPKEEPALPKEEPALPEKEPTLLEAEPTLLEAEPTLPVEEPTLPEEESTLPEEEPTLPEEEPTLPVEEPTLPEEEPTLPEEESTSSEEDTPLIGLSDSTTGLLSMTSSSMGIETAPVFSSLSSSKETIEEKEATPTEEVESSTIIPPIADLKEAAPVDNIINFETSEPEEEPEETVIEETETTVEIIETVQKKPRKKTKKKSTTKKKVTPAATSDEEQPKKKRGRKKKVLTPEEEEAKKKRRRGRKKTTLKIDLASIEVPSDFMSEEDDGKASYSTPPVARINVSDSVVEAPLDDEATIPESSTPELPHDEELDQLVASADQQIPVDESSHTEATTLDEMAQAFEEPVPTFDDSAINSSETVQEQEPIVPMETIAPSDDSIADPSSTWTDMEREQDNSLTTSVDESTSVAFEEVLPPKDDGTIELDPSVTPSNDIDLESFETPPTILTSEGTPAEDITTTTIDEQLPPSLSHDENRPVLGENENSSTEDALIEESSYEKMAATLEQTPPEIRADEIVDNWETPPEETKEETLATSKIPAESEVGNDDVLINEPTSSTTEVATFEDFDKAFTASAVEASDAVTAPDNFSVDEHVYDNAISLPEENIPVPDQFDVTKIKEETTSFDEIDQVFNDLSPATEELSTTSSASTEGQDLPQDSNKDSGIEEDEGKPGSPSVLDALVDEDQQLENKDMLDSGIEQENVIASESDELVESSSMEHSNAQDNLQSQTEEISMDKDELESEFSLDALTSQEESRIEEEVVSDPSVIDELKQEESSKDIGLEFDTSPYAVASDTKDDSSPILSQDTVEDDRPAVEHETISTTQEVINQSVDEDIFNVESPISEVAVENQSDPSVPATSASETAFTDDPFSSSTADNEVSDVDDKDQDYGGPKKVQFIQSWWKIIVAALIGILVGFGGGFYWFGIHQNKQLTLEVNSLVEKVKQSTEELVATQSELDDLKDEYEGLQNGPGAIQYDKAPEKPKYYKSGKGAILYWLDNAPIRRYHVYRAKGTTGELKKVTGNPIDKNVIRFRKISQGSWRFAVTAVNQDGQETEKSEILKLKFPLAK